MKLNRGVGQGEKLLPSLGNQTWKLDLLLDKLPDPKDSKFALKLSHVK